MLLTFLLNFYFFHKNTSRTYELKMFILCSTCEWSSLNCYTIVAYFEDKTYPPAWISNFQEKQIHKLIRFCVLVLVNV